MSGLAATLLWPLVAVTLVLLGMTFASSGASTTAAGERRAAGGAPRGGRRETDRLPGERTMVVVTGETSAGTVANAIAAARGGGEPVDVVADARHPHPRWESRG